MADSAALAVSSIIEDVQVSTVEFNTYLARPVTAGEIIARGRFLSVSGDHLLAESVLTDSEGQELGRGSGAFMKSTVPLAPADEDA